MQSEGPIGTAITTVDRSDRWTTHTSRQLGNFDLLHCSFHLLALWVDEVSDMFLGQHFPERWVRTPVASLTIKSMGPPSIDLLTIIIVLHWCATVWSAESFLAIVFVLAINRDCSSMRYQRSSSSWVFVVLAEVNRHLAVCISGALLLVRRCLRSCEWLLGTIPLLLLVGLEVIVWIGTRCLS